MELHFYTSYDNIQMLKEGDDIRVWTKHDSDITDIHISLNISHYAFHKLNEHLYNVSKIKLPRY